MRSSRAGMVWKSAMGATAVVTTPARGRAPAPDAGFVPEGVMSHTTIVESAASGPHALWRGRGRGVIRRGAAGSVPARSAAAEDAALAAEAAFAALVARHGPMVLGVCRRALADPNDVEDAFQATFLVLVRRARSVRVGDSLGRWLYGVARRVAAKAQARSERARVRSVPLAREPVAPEPPADRIELLAALDEEVSRLPEKYRAPVVLCHLEGLTHAEAAERLRWPVGTVSGRLSRARDLLRDRLVRRGMAPTAGSMVALLATEGARAAVPEPLAAATVRAATRLAMGGGSQAGVASVSASALSLMNAVLRAAVVVKLKVAAAVLLAIAVAGAAVGAGIGVGTGVAQTRLDDQDAGRAPAVASHAVAHPTADHRPADEIVKEIEAALAMAAELGLGYPATANSD